MLFLYFALNRRSFILSTIKMSALSKSFYTEVDKYDTSPNIYITSLPQKQQQQTKVESMNNPYYCQMRKSLPLLSQNLSQMKEVVQAKDPRFDYKDFVTTVQKKISVWHNSFCQNCRIHFEESQDQLRPASLLLEQILSSTLSPGENNFLLQSAATALRRGLKHFKKRNACVRSPRMPTRQSQAINKARQLLKKKRKLAKKIQKAIANNEDIHKDTQTMQQVISKAQEQANNQYISKDLLQANEELTKLIQSMRIRY